MYISFLLWLFATFVTNNGIYFLTITPISISTDWMILLGVGRKGTIKNSVLKEKWEFVIFFRQTLKEGIVYTSNFNFGVADIGPALIGNKVNAVEN